MNDRPSDPRVQFEPHVRPDEPLAPDPSEAAARRAVEQNAAAESDADRVDHSVWDEPGLSPSLLRDDADAEPGTRLTYAHWLRTRIDRTSAGRSWAVTILVASVAGLWGVVGAILSGGQTIFGVVMLVAVAPLTEEVMKVAVALWIVERRPYLFRSAGQILLCAAAGGFVFAALENVLYLTVYIPDPPEALIRWRWTVCVAMHTGCSLIAGLGLTRIWSHTVRTMTRPRLSLGSPALICAVVIHGSYNGSAVLMQLSGLGF